MSLPDLETFIPLALLQAVKGVSTVWVWDEKGGLMFGSVEGQMIEDGSATEESWQQITSLLSSHPTPTPGSEELTLDFETYLLHARREARVVVAIMAKPEVNRNAVRLGVNMFYRHLKNPISAAPRHLMTGNQG